MANKKLDSVLTKAHLRLAELTFVCVLILTISLTNLFAQSENVRPETASKVLNQSAAVNSSEPSGGNAVQTASFTEGFDGGAIPAGWSVQNLSSPIGTNTPCWNIFTGSTPWVGQAGTGHIGANFNCVVGNNTISGWLFSPVISFKNGDQIKFWTRKASPDSFADRLELRLSLAGTSVNAGATATSVGDFTTVLVSVNPTLVTGVYPTAFTQFTATISGVPTATDGRVAFRYFVTSGGPDGANSDIISIDTFDYLTAPTAAGASVGGKVRSARGGGIANALVTLTNFAGQKRTVLTNSFGNYRFNDIDSGQTYVLSVSSKRFAFDNPTQVLNVTDNLSEVNFTATP